MGCSASRSHAFITKDQQYTSHHSSSSHSQSAYSDSLSTQVSRTLSLPTPLVHHPPLCKGDTNHLVSLTSTTYGSLVLIDSIPKDPHLKGFDLPNSTTPSPKSHNSRGSIDPLSSYTVVNTWELMEGLDELDFEVVHAPIESPGRPNFSMKSKSFDSGYFRKESEVNEVVNTYEFVEHKDTKPLWQHLSEESLLAKMDPVVASSYQRAVWSKRFGCKELKDEVKENKIESAGSNNMNNENSLLWTSDFYLHGVEDRIVLYYTSLRGIRKTYEDCCEVRMIFRGFRVCIDERDISMDSSYRKELQDVLEGKAVSLPRVFIRGKYIGGVDEIKQLHEAGDLAKLLIGFPLKDLLFICESCGDARFVPCVNCYGSRKVFEESAGKLRRCPQCNENGLIRCPSCYPSLLLC